MFYVFFHRNSINVGRYVFSQLCEESFLDIYSERVNCDFLAKKSKNVMQALAEL
jgi:hypothetical protein